MTDYSSFLRDTDLSGMAPRDAREYVLAFMKTFKETLWSREKTEMELELWRDRVRLAEGAGRADLVAAARNRESECLEKLAALELEKRELEAKVEALKENLRKLEGQFQHTIDAEQLLVELGMLVGEEKQKEDELLQKFKEEQARSDLEELKKKLTDGS